jgi:hypothetical protein
MAFGMPAELLSSRIMLWKRQKNGQLDILAFGMPKI